MTMPSYPPTPAEIASRDGNDCGQILDSDVDEARKLGLRLHYDLGDQGAPSAWYAAKHLWVIDYHRNGGIWAYRS